MAVTKVMSLRVEQWSFIKNISVSEDITEVCILFQETYSNPNSNYYFIHSKLDWESFH